MSCLTFLYWNLHIKFICTMKNIWSDVWQKFQIILWFDHFSPRSFLQFCYLIQPWDEWLSLLQVMQSFHELPVKIISLVLPHIMKDGTPFCWKSSNNASCPLCFGFIGNESDQHNSVVNVCANLLPLLDSLTDYRLTEEEIRIHCLWWKISNHHMQQNR